MKVSEQVRASFDSVQDCVTENPGHTLLEQNGMYWLK